MAKSTHDDVLDAACNYIKNNCDKLVACSTFPTTFTEANVTYALADVAVDAADFTVGDGDVSGRKVAVAAQDDVPVDTTGTFEHWACLDVGETKVLHVGEGTSQGLTQGNTADFPTVDIEFTDPT